MSTPASQRPVPYIPESAPFSEEQRQWLNGFFAGLFSAAPVDPAAMLGQSPVPALATPPVPVLILFGSQTGNAEGLAKKVKATAEKTEWLCPASVGHGKI